VREDDFSSVYDISEAMVAPAPGITPMTKPRSEPRIMVTRVST
jgi:hypothetical protein